MTAASEKNKRKRQRLQRNRHERLKAAVTDGWKKCNEFHFQKCIGGKLVNWWPSRMKCMIDNQVYRVFSENDIVDVISSQGVQ